MNLLVVGGAGYIGSHMGKMLARQGKKVTILDNFSTGYRDAVLAGEVVVGDLADSDFLDQTFTHTCYDYVLHFASFIQVGESVAHPDKYYRNNFHNTQNLLDAMVRHNVRHFIFSSTAAIFGEPHYIPIDEAHPKSPVNPYGRSKYMVEQLLEDYDRAYAIKSVCLRYFNAAGADPEGLLGERHDPETHLIPLALQTISGRRKTLTVFGRDYDTPDGTCIRDYVHIMDLCDAHIKAIDWLKIEKGSAAFNLGNGNGFSVAEVLDAVEKVTGKKVPVIEGNRRNGDPAKLVADSTRAKTELGWKPRYADLETIISHAWAWEQKMSKM